MASDQLGQTRQGAQTPGGECAHCKVPITDPTTQVVHGGLTYCCSNCSAALEQAGPGSDPDSATGKNHLKCAHCGTAIVNEDNMQLRGEQMYCCPNCARGH